MTDRLTLAHALEEGGMARAAAEHIATEIYDAIHENVATKTDITAVRSDIEALRLATKTDLRDLEQRLKIWLGSMIVIVTTVLFAALHIWPPHA